MMREKISHWQAIAFIVNLILPTAVLLVPSIISASAGVDSWASLIVALILGLLVAWLSITLARGLPEETVIEYAPKIMGNYLGNFFGILIILYFYMASFFVMRQFFDLISTSYLTATPSWVIMGVIAIVASYAVYLGLEPICRANVIVMFILLLAVLLIVGIEIKNMHPENFKPVLTTPPKKIFAGALIPTGWFTESIAILMLMPNIENKKKVWQVPFFALLICFLAMLAVVLVCIGVFDASTSARFTFPLFRLARVTQIEKFSFLERIDVWFMVAWVAATMFKFILFFYLATLSLAQWCRLPSYKPLIIPGVILITTLSLSVWEGITEVVYFSKTIFVVLLFLVNVLLTVIMVLFSFRQYPHKGVE